LKTEFEPHDIQLLAEKIVEGVKSLLPDSTNSNCDIIFKPETLAEYLNVDTTWVYKQVTLKTIPYFKTGKYVRFKKSHIDRWIKTKSVEPLLPYKISK